MSSRSFDPTLPANRAGVTAMTAIRCPQCGQGRRKLGRRDGATSLKDTEVLLGRDNQLTRLFPTRFARESRKICATHIKLSHRDMDPLVGHYCALLDPGIDPAVYLHAKNVNLPACHG